MKKSDEKLYEEAEARVGFRMHLRTYLVINILIWAFWYFTRGINGHYDGFWPIYATLGWGFGLAAHYMGVYGSGKDAVQKEYEKLKREQGA